MSVLYESLPNVKPASTDCHNKDAALILLLNLNISCISRMFIGAVKYVGGVFYNQSQTFVEGGGIHKQIKVRYGLQSTCILQSDNQA